MSHLDQTYIWTRHKMPQKWVISALLICSFTFVLLLNLDGLHSHITVSLSSRTLSNKTWVSMALCWGYKVNMLQKSHFPYAYAGLLSAELWPKVVADTHVVFQIVTCNESAKMEDYLLGDYVKSLQQHGAIVKLVFAPKCDQSCVTQAQVVRLLAFAFKEVAPTDFVVMSDVDAFPMKKAVFDPILRNREKSVWVLQYDTAIKYGFTFSMSFTALRAETWKEILGNPKDANDLIENFSPKLGFDQRNATWEYDQLIMTRAILESKLCSLPKNNSLWSHLNMSPTDLSEDDDWQTCFKGENLQDCHRDFALHDCRHWHFLPTERREELHEKYLEILGLKSKDSDVRTLAKNVKFELEKIFGLRNR